MISNTLFFSAKIPVSSVIEAQNKAKQLSQESGKPTAFIGDPNGDYFVLTEQDLYSTVQQEKESVKSGKEQADLAIFDALSDKPYFSRDRRLHYVDKGALGMIDDGEEGFFNSGDSFMTNDVTEINLPRLKDRLKQSFFLHQEKS